MPRGTVEWFSGGKGHTGIASGGFEPLDEGGGVSFEATQGQKDMQADNVSKA